jgi:ATP phosphoribosyltransferase regulatory subunit
LYRALARSAGLDGTGEGNDADLFAALRDKDAPAVQEITQPLPEPARGALRALATLYGPADATLASAASVLPALPEVQSALQALATLASSVKNVDAIHVDLADLRGYHYYTGATFSVFAQDGNGAIADCGRGGRYDGVGRAFGRARPATGFSMDLRRLASRIDADKIARVIVAPADEDASLAKAIKELRAKGEIVIVALPSETHEGASKLVKSGASWRVVES